MKNQIPHLRGFECKKHISAKKVKYKVQSPHSFGIADSSIYEGRTYKDCQTFFKKFPDTRVTAMDTALGCEGSHKVLLTFHFDCCYLMMACLLDSEESRHEKAVFDFIEHAIGALSFSNAFSFLPDRDGKFQVPDTSECKQDNLIRTSIYY